MVSLQCKRILTLGMAMFCALALGWGGVAAALDLGGALDKVGKTAEKAARSVESATQSKDTESIPSGASLEMRKVDQKLDKMERMMGEGGRQYDKDYRVKEAEANLAEAKEAMATVERRYGSRMGADHPELVKRNDRIAAGEKSLEAFKGEMGEAQAEEKAAQEDKDKADAAAETVRQEKSAEEMAQREKANAEARAAAEAPKTGGGTVVFSKSPINAASPANLTTSFKAGDSIYALIEADKTWRQLLKGEGKTELGIMVVLAVNGSETLQYVTLKKPEYIDSKQLVLDIAPEPAKMTAYKNPAIEFGEGKGNRKIGPIAYTYDLSQLPPGKHKVEVFVRDYGDKPAAGSFEIEGADFKFYADLHEKVKAASDAMATMPPAGMVNKELEGQMRKLLENAGWSNTLRIVIIDKDWWLEGQASRYLNVAAAAKGSDGQCYWSNLQFSQPKLISGAWGALELSKTGIKRPIAEANVFK